MATIRITLPFSTATIDANTATSNQIFVGVNEAVGAPELASGAFGWQGATLDPSGTVKGNAGLYGVNATYRFTAINSHATDYQAILAGLTLRNNSSDVNYSKFWGAAWISAPYVDGRPMKGVPVLRCREFLIPLPIRYQEWIQLDTQPAVILPPGGTSVVDVSVASGGGAALPINLWAWNAAVTEA